MGSYEYKVITAPSKGARGPGVKGADGRFAHSLEQAINDLAAEGWEYQRAETLPSEERSGLSSTTTVYRSLLIFRRKKRDDLGAYDPRLLDQPATPTLLLPTPDDDEEDSERRDPNADHGLSALLRRRAARLFPAGQSADQAPVQSGDDLAEDEGQEEGQADDGNVTPMRRSAAE
ncbi:DUF4177 domain-containing protein [Pseudooceanicola sp. MF1-13]|uniref:DUF4177 domain-containing protein n=1 Tax=Pseudooceanicola sp. MF1-13 TaxID=3379095 RepID=UPI00389236A7